MIPALRRFWETLTFARFVARRCPVRPVRLVRRRRDWTLWAAWHPQNYGYAMRGLFTRVPRDRWHFVRVREWKGAYLVSPKTFWLPESSSEFHIVSVDEISAMVTPPLPEVIECARIDRIRGDGPPPAVDPIEVGKRIRIVPDS